MIFQTKNIQIHVGGLDLVRDFLKLALKQVRDGEATAEEFVASVEDAFTDQTCPLSWDDAVIMRAVKGDK